MSAPRRARRSSSRAPLDLRVNTLKATREEAARSARRVQRRRPTRWSPWGLRIVVAPDSKSPAIHAEPAFLKGQIEIQDEGSQLAALLSGAKPGEQVIDLCAGAGGKTLALAAMMENHGQIHATDTDKRRLAPIHERLERSGARNVQVRTPRGDNEIARRSDRTRRSRADRRALHRHRRVAPQPGRQVARAPRRARRAAEGPGRNARPCGRRW